MTTGAGYKVSRNDGRATYFEGQRVDDLAAHEILGQSVEIIASGYDRAFSTDPDAVSAVVTIPGSAAERKERTLHRHEMDRARALALKTVGLSDMSEPQEESQL